MNLQEAAQQALEALEEIEWSNNSQWQSDRAKVSTTALRAALADEAMQRLADEQQMIERGTKAWADVPDATAWVDEMRGNVPAPTSQESRQVEPVGYGVFEDGNLHDSFRLEHEAKLFAALKGEHAEVGALYRSPPNQSEDTLGMVEPVAWRFYDGKIWCYVNHISDLSASTKFEPLYTAPPKREPLTDEEIDYWIGSNSTKKALCRAIERAHDIGGGE